ncbi:hypothetical protein SMD20_39710 [Nonomuraea sp. LP-02]|uniref:hypothetical protein n=1 Tax=Nonomuraea sp. LP-02 TaxID=3097960 RepID=UPI002E36B1E5|nr:hypothetical protein [Nonomuraea sp. LP-02]MED7930409.1 hypothetical protein [Nonomuraea sp. LP-02]
MRRSTKGPQEGERLITLGAAVRDGSVEISDLRQERRGRRCVLARTKKEPEVAENPADRCGPSRELRRAKRAAVDTSVCHAGDCLGVVPAFVVDDEVVACFSVAVPLKEGVAAQLVVLLDGQEDHLAFEV